MWWCQKFEFYFTEFGIIPNMFLGMRFAWLLFGLVRFDIGIFRSLQNIAFCKVSCDVFTKNVAFYYF